MKKNTRGIAFVAVLPWIAGLALAAFGYHEYATLFAPGRNKAKSDQAATAAALTSTQAVTVSAGADAVKVAVDRVTVEHAAVIAKRDAINLNVAGFIEGARQAVAADPNPSDADLVAAALLDSATAAIGQPLTIEQRAVWTKTVSALISKNAEAKARIAKMTLDAAALRASLDATQAHAKAADAQAATLADQVAANAKELTASAVKTAGLTADIKKWADNEPNMLARIKALGGLAAVLLIGLVWYEIKRRGLTGAVHDAVALKEHIQTTAATLGADAEKLKQSAETWWADAPKDKTVFDKLKSDLRL